MDHYREYQCEACDYYFSHPIDRCPICGDQFFWLVSTARELRADEKLTFVATMKNLCGAGVTEAFLTHRDRLWLPYNFWEKDPGGETLQPWSYVKGVKLFQHKKQKASNASDSTARAGVFDTKPAMVAQPQWESLNAFSPGSISPGLKPESHVQQIQPLHQYRAEPASEKINQPMDTSEPIGVQDWLPPVLIFVFFLLLSLSFLVLRYHRNVRAPQVSSYSEVVSYDHSILS